MCLSRPRSPFFFFNDTATTEIYTLSLHDALPISRSVMIPVMYLAGVTSKAGLRAGLSFGAMTCPKESPARDRKSTRLNSSHDQISYAVFCLKKKKTRSSRTRCDVVL